MQMKKKETISMNIAIVGAGLLGRVIAINLLKNKEHKVTLFDKDSKKAFNSAAFTSAGMLAPYVELERAESEVAELGLKSIELWPSLLEEIGASECYEQKGSIVTSHPQDMADLNHFISKLSSKADVAEVIEELDRDKIMELEPDLQNHQKAYWVKNEGVIDVQNFMAFSTKFLEEHPNVVFREFCGVKKIEPKKVFLDDKIVEFDWVFDARGLGAKEHFEDLRGVRGEILWVETDEIKITRPTRIVHPRYTIYIVPRTITFSETEAEYFKDFKAPIDGKKNIYVIGATEIETEDTSPITVRSTMELLSALYTVHPSFGEARVINSEANCRPSFKDNLPRVETSKGLSRINGLYRHGWLVAPAIVENLLKEIGLND